MYLGAIDLLVSLVVARYLTPQGSSDGRVIDAPVGTFVIVLVLLCWSRGKDAAFPSRVGRYLHAAESLVLTHTFLISINVFSVTRSRRQGKTVMVCNNAGELEG